MKSLFVRYLFALGFGLAAGSSLNAQRMTLADSTAAPVVVESAEISSEITGQFAVTTFDLVFRNPNNRQLEGTFEFPLLDGQSVTRFALDIGGVLREAVPVAKERGRVVFEEIERRRVDPGLLEQTAGNNYRARVFPLPAQGTRRIVIAYQEALPRNTSDEATFRLALDFPERLKRFTLGVSLFAAGPTSPKVRSTLPFRWPSWRDSRVLSVEQSDVQPTGVFELTLPKIDAVSLMTQRFGEREYFYAEVPVPQIQEQARPIPKVVGILWDASGSGRDRDRTMEFAFLDRWFAAAQDVEVRLVQCRDVAARPETFVVKNGNWSGLRRAMKRIVYDGATSFDGLTDDATVDEWLLFSDGLINYGSSMAGSRLPLTAPVHAVASSARADTARLRGYAMRHGGEFANLLEIEAETAAARVRSFSVRVLGIERDPEEAAEIFPEVGAPIPGRNMAIAGVLRGGEATIRFRIGHSEADALEIDVPVQSGADVGRLAARAWASAKINALSTDLEGNRSDIRRTSEEFGIVTADTSLIVLETLADYVRYAIAPPAELRKQWDAQQFQAATTGQKQRDAHIEHVVASFARRQRWWELGAASNYRPMVEVPPTRSSSAQRNVVSNDSSGSGSGWSPIGATWPESTEIADDGSGEEVIVLSPFVVSAEEDVGYYTASNTLSGTRVRTTLSDVSSSASFGRNRRSRSDRGARVSGDASGAESNAGGGDFVLQPWSPKAGYLDRLHGAQSGEAYAIYLEERVDHVRDAGFFLDAAEFFFEAEDESTALRVLSNLAELQLEDAALLRVLGQRLMQASQPALALPVFERVLKIRGEDPQSRRDLALACAAAGQNQRAIDLLWEVVATPWHGRFPDIEMVALGELNAIVATCGETLDLSRVDERLRRNLDVGLRAVLTWDADNCDIDLWVEDPDGERAFFNHPLTRQGGLMSRDFTGGYGPEEFLLRNPKPGKYTVRINYFADQRNTALGPVTVQVRLIRGFGTPEQKEECMTVRLTTNKETIKVGTIEVPGDAAAIAAANTSSHSGRKGPRGF